MGVKCLNYYITFVCEWFSLSARSLSLLKDFILFIETTRIHHCLVRVDGIFIEIIETHSIK